MKTYKSIKHFERRLKKGIDWGDYIKVNGKMYKMVEYADGLNDNYMLFQNKTSKEVIEIRYQVPCFEWINEKKIQTKFYQFFSIETYILDCLYRY